MTPKGLLTQIIEPSLGVLSVFVDKKVDIASIEAKLLLIAIGIQESGLTARRQFGHGPARSWWQIEELTALDTIQRWRPLKAYLTYLEIPIPIHTATLFGYVLQYSEYAACGIARGILALDPSPLPTVGDLSGAWETYRRCWRPGKPRLEKWDSSYQLALEAVS